MGLHPEVILAVMAVVLDLLRRGYRVVLSTHSPAVLDVQWVLKRLGELHAPTSDVRELLDPRSSTPTDQLATRALEIDSRAYYCRRDGIVKDISALDPGTMDEDESGWGGLTGFSSRTGRVLARAAQCTCRENGALPLGLHRWGPHPPWKPGGASAGGFRAGIAAGGSRAAMIRCQHAWIVDPPLDGPARQQDEMGSRPELENGIPNRAAGGREVEHPGIVSERRSVLEHWQDGAALALHVEAAPFDP